jgi:predicted DNA binding CopG/RHH family protein
MKNTASKKKAPVDYTDDAEQWESRKLGADERYVKVSEQGTEDRLDESLNLQMVSMRLPKEAVQKLKVLARKQGLGYQPLIRQILMKYLEIGELPQKKRQIKPSPLSPEEMEPLDD